MGVLIQLGLFVVMLTLGFVVGRVRESRHLSELEVRETRMRHVAALPVPHAAWVRDAQASELVSGSVVVSIDYYKRFVAGLRGLVGGRIAGFESVLDRGRREAVLRMQEQALQRGFHVVVNVRVDSARLASTMSNGKGTSGVEVLAYGTALRLPAHARPSA